MYCQTKLNFPERKLRLANKKDTVDENLSPVKDKNKSGYARNLLNQFENTCNSPLEAKGVHSPSTPSPLKRQRDLLFNISSPSKRVKNDTATVSPSTLIRKIHLESPTQAAVQDNYRQGKLAPIQLFKQDVSPYQATKQALHTSIPDRLLCRERQIQDVTDFLCRHLKDGKSGSLYISGAPGTGKTTTLQHVLETHEFSEKFRKIYINCMSLRKSSAIYGRIAKDLDAQFSEKNDRQIIKRIVKKLTSGQMTLLILDELDQLDSKNQEVLYTVFEWPTIPCSKLVLVGIANALDLTDRVLPRLQVNPKCRPELMHFPPYTKQQIVEIINGRIKDVVSEGNEVLKPGAVQYLAGKIAAAAGDVRKALDVCRRAIEVVENDARKQKILKTTSDDGCNPGSPSKASRSKGLTPVSLPHIMRVMSEVYGSRVTLKAEGSSSGITLPLHEKVFVATLLLVVKSGQGKEVSAGKLMDVYLRVCKKRNMTSANSDFFGLCQLVESKGVINIKNHKEVRMRKISLRLDEEEVKLAMHDTNLLVSILNDKSVLTR